MVFSAAVYAWPLVSAQRPLRVAQGLKTGARRLNYNQPQRVRQHLCHSTGQLQTVAAAAAVVAAAAVAELLQLLLRRWAAVADLLHTSVGEP